MNTQTPAPAAAPEAAPAKGKAKFRLPKKKSRLAKWIKRLVVLAIAALLVLFGLRRCSAGAGQAAAGLYIPAAAAYQDMQVTVSATGTVEPANSYKVTALVTGEVLSAPFEEGDTVAKGDLLYQLDASDVQTNVDQARLQLEQSRLSYSDAVDLKTTGGGTVESLRVKVGDTVNAGDVIADIADRGTVTLKVPFLKQNAQQLSPGEACSVTVNGYPGTYPGVIREVSGADTVDAGGAIVRWVKAELANPGAITQDMTGSLSAGGFYASASGSFSYAAASQVTAGASGTVSALSVTEGSAVSAGQVIGSLGATSAAAGADLSLQQAQLSYESALDRLDDYTVTAPISGTVVEKVYKAGDKLDSSSSNNSKGYMAVIYDLSALKLELAIDELDIPKVQLGQQVVLTADALPGRTFTGTVSKININGTTANNVTSYPVTVEVPYDEALYPGMNVSAKIVVEEAGNVLCIPVEAVSRGDQVLVAGPGAMNEDNTAVVDPTKLETRTVTLGRNDSTSIEVTSGLSEGDIVLIQNQASDSVIMMGG